MKCSAVQVALNVEREKWGKKRFRYSQHLVLLLLLLVVVIAIREFINGINATQ